MKKQTYKKYLIAAYYVFVFTALASQIVKTVYLGSVNIYQAGQLKAIKTEGKVLSERHAELSLQLATTNSLHLLANSDTLQSYTQIKNPIIITDKALVALK